MGLEKILDQKNCDKKKIVIKKKIWFENNFGSKINFLFQKNFG